MHGGQGNYPAMKMNDLCIKLGSQKSIFYNYSLYHLHNYIANKKRPTIAYKRGDWIYNKDIEVGLSSFPCPKDYTALRNNKKVYR